MKKSEKMFITLGVAVTLMLSVAATKSPPESKEIWEYRVLKEKVGAPDPLNQLLNSASKDGWLVDSFSAYSTGNSENGIVILKRIKRVEASR